MVAVELAVVAVGEGVVVVVIIPDGVLVLMDVSAFCSMMMVGRGLCYDGAL